MDEIEKLKQERDEILAKALRLIELEELAEGGTAINREDWDLAVRELRALRPKPKPLELWVNTYPNNGHSSHESREDAEAVIAGISKQNIQRVAVPMIEVRPLPELPEMEEWKTKGERGINSGDVMFWAETKTQAEHITNRHNAAVRAFKAWAEDAKKEVGDE